MLTTTNNSQVQIGTHDMKAPLDRGSLVLTREQSRKVDQIAIDRFGISGLVLMENAGRQSVDAMINFGCRGPFLILCGTGNNGGDGFVIARHLIIRNFVCRVIVLGDPERIRGDAKENFDILLKTDCDIEQFDGDATIESMHGFLTTSDGIVAGSIVDAILGTGANGPLKPEIRAVIDVANSLQNITRVAIDLPTGIDCDSGQSFDRFFDAKLTCTFVTQKPAHRFADCGQVKVLDIGVPANVVQMITS